MTLTFIYSVRCTTENLSRIYRGPTKPTECTYNASHTIGSVQLMGSTRTTDVQVNDASYIVENDDQGDVFILNVGVNTIVLQKDQPTGTKYTFVDSGAITQDNMITIQTESPETVHNGPHITLHIPTTSLTVFKNSEVSWILV